MELPKFRDLFDSLVNVRAKLLTSLATLAKKEAILNVQKSESFPSLSVADDHHQKVFQRNSSFIRRAKEESCISEAAEHGCDASSFSSIALPVVEFEVFLSFRGPDTRKGFADCLYCGLSKAGIRVFRDTEGLHIGENLRELLVAINSSKICIPILSKGYASSRWCLQELAQMVECSKLTRVEIFPIFYDVKPSEVQLEKGPYVEALKNHKEQFDPKIVQQWEDALRAVGRIKGWELQKATDGHEGKLIELVVRKVLVSLKVHRLNVTDQLVAIDDHVTKILRMLNVDSRDVRIGGIHGMGGIGKTTLAKVVYNQLSRHFEYCSFLADVRETSEHKGLEYLQNQLISQILKDKAPDIANIDDGIKVIKERLYGKEVLILLDDVDKKMQLNALVGNGSWFGSGSKIIITTRNKDILNVPEVDWTHELNGMDFEPSLQLFSRHAFRRDYPPDDYLKYSEKVVEISGGLPLALENIGSFLSGKSKEVWDSTLKKLEKLPHEEVEKKLRISYDALDDLQKHIFLDIACLFIGYDRRIVVHMWDDSQFFPEEGIEVLLLMSLIKIVEDNKLWMHDQMRDLGRKIVYQENNFEPRKRSRLWNHRESLSMLDGKKGSELVQALCLKFDSRNQYHLTNEEFVSLSNLRFLQINGVHLSGNFENLLSELRWLCWHYSPPRFHPTNFHPRNLIVLDLSWSKITEDWEGWHHVKMANNLKVMNLTGCVSLFRIPDFSGFMALERLILKGCEGLVEINASPDDLRHLNSLDIQDCCRIRKLPDNLCFMESLRELLVDGTSIQEISIPPGCLKKLETLSARNCKSLVQVSSSIGYLESLSHLALDNSRITCLPDSTGELIKLERLSLRGCRSISKLPFSIGQLGSLVFLDLSGTGFTELPISIENMKNLKVLSLEGSCIKQLPPVIGMLEKLEEIHARSCSDLEGEIPCEIGEFSLDGGDPRSCGPE
ncbi:TMV resistance protein N-like isoform X2 [Punica granatum]|uniref:TMV resistance protein N-like isoform X2 n=2 Tax=Punica granatum TaxID=22663 RepID=A0A6P8D3H6_PUNGR|nr:TMV resistance protein N-like isoform X2 [Punica granatum]